MPRRPRVSIEGGIYHVYNRFALGAERFLKLLRTARDRDGLSFLAWCLTSDRSHSVALWFRMTG